MPLTKWPNGQVTFQLNEPLGISNQMNSEAAYQMTIRVCVISLWTHASNYTWHRWNMSRTTHQKLHVTQYNIKTAPVFKINIQKAVRCPLSQNKRNQFSRYEIAEHIGLNDAPAFEDIWEYLCRWGPPCFEVKRHTIETARKMFRDASKGKKMRMTPSGPAGWVGPPSTPPPTAPPLKAPSVPAKAPPKAPVWKLKKQDLDAQLDAYRSSGPATSSDDLFRNLLTS